MPEAVVFKWSRKPGEFVDKVTGEMFGFCSFNGSIREWYETLIEVMIDVQNTVWRKSGMEFLQYLSWRGDPNICCIVETSVLYKPFLVGKELGTVGDRGGGTIVNIPINEVKYLIGTGVLQLVQFAGSDAEEVLGGVEVLDYKVDD